MARTWPKAERRQFVETVRAYLLASGAEQNRIWYSMFGDGLPAYRFSVDSVAGLVTVAVYPGADRHNGLGWIPARFQNHQAGQQIGADRFGQWNWWPDDSGSLQANISAAMQRFASAGIAPSPVEIG